MKARDVPTVRDTLISDLRRVDWDNGYWETGGLPVPTRESVDAVIAALGVAELFFVTSPMERLTRDAVQTLPQYQLQREELPTQVGMLIWELPHPVVANDRGAGELDIVGVLWQDMGTKVRIVDIADMHREVDAKFPEDYDAWLQRYPHYSYSKSYEITYGDHVWPEDESGLDISKVEFMQRSRAALVVTWLLMGQEIVTVGHHVPRSKAAIRRATRRNLSSEVRVVTLRHTAHDPAEVEAQLDGAGRNYHHRWYVRGHWRKQWYPSRRAHRPIWIPTHLKGPDGAPLLTGTIVKVLSR